MPNLGFIANVLPQTLLVSRLWRPFAASLLVATFALITLSQAPAKTEDPKKLAKQASELTRSGLLVEAENTLRRALDLDKTRIDTKIELAFVLVKQRRLREGYDIVFPIVEADPKNSRALAVLGVTLLSAGRFQDARLVFYNAIRSNRKEHLAWAGLGMVDFYENRITDSLNSLREAVYYQHDEPDYLFALAQVSARAELYKESAEAYREFLSVSDNSDADRRARIRGLISFLNYLGNVGALYTSAGKEQTSVSFKLVGNRPIIRLKINGNETPLNFVLDTGSGMTVISDAVAKKLNIKPITKGGFAKGIGGNGKFEIVYGMIRQIEIGEVSLRNVPIYIRKFHTDNMDVDGYIGLALISKFLTTIDYGRQTFSLTKRDSDVNTAAADNSDLSLPLRLTSSGFLSGQVQLEGIEAPLNFIVDTGASVSVISDQVSKSDGFSLFANEEKLRVIGSAGVTDDVSTFMLPRITFGKHSSTDIMAVALDLDIINEASGFEQSGILGGNFLKNYRLTFDFKNSRVTFVSVKPEKE